MRAPKIASSPIAALVAGLSLAGLAVASPALAEPGASPASVDTSAYREHMVVLHDGAGHYVITVPVSEHYTTLFYGDGKTFYEQVTFGGGLDLGNQSASAHFWDPRVDHRATVEQVKGTWQVLCGKRKSALTALPADGAKQIIDKAVFLEPLWKHQAYALARDDRGNYYYVDRLRDAHGGKGFRLWFGPKGAMKRLQMTNIVSDSQGDIFATRRGELRFILSKNSSIWVQGKSRKDLVNVPVRENVRLIYTELGVYLGDLGTPCDHL
jgi:hypothetical protein